MVQMWTLARIYKNKQETYPSQRVIDT